MQIKKDEVKQKLLDAARYEFMQHGFERASIRSIVKSAETTIGNFYNYFENKESVFSSLVADIYNGFSYVLANHDNFAGSGMDDVDIYSIDMLSLRPMISAEIQKVLFILDSSFLLLIEKSKGTKYENSKQELIDMMSVHFLMHIEETNPSYPHPEIGKVLAHQLIEGILSILKTYKNMDEKLNMLTELMIYTIAGMIGILKGEQND
ncbi:MAG: TetR/AcrR family transcriptional regulator [Eubacteriales bacterium]